MVLGTCLGVLTLIMWAPCIKKGVWTKPGPVYAKDRNNRVFQITPTGKCCDRKCTGARAKNIATMSIQLHDQNTNLISLQREVKHGEITSPKLFKKPTGGSY